MSPTNRECTLTELAQKRAVIGVLSFSQRPIAAPVVYMADDFVKSIGIVAPMDLSLSDKIGQTGIRYIRSGFRETGQDIAFINDMYTRYGVRFRLLWVKLNDNRDVCRVDWIQIRDGTSSPGRKIEAEGYAKTSARDITVVGNAIAGMRNSQWVMYPDVNFAAGGKAIDLPPNLALFHGMYST